MVNKPTISLFADRPFDDSLQHGRSSLASCGRHAATRVRRLHRSGFGGSLMSMPGMLPMPPSALPRFDSASTRNVADATTVSPATSPRRISTRSSLDAPSATSRGASCPLGSLDEHDVSLAGRQHGVARHRQHARTRGTGNTERGVHARLEPHVAVGQHDSHARRTRVRIDRRIDVRDAAHAVLAGQRLKVRVHRLADSHRREVLLEHLAFDPHRAQIGHAIQRVAAMIFWPASTFFSST